MAVSNSTTRLILSLGAVTILSALLLGMVAQFTKEPIARQEIAYELSAVKGALNLEEGSAVPEGAVLEKTTLPESGTEAYRLRSGQNVLGAALKTAFPGYAGDVVCVTGINPEGKVTGIEIVQSQETPGLGTKAFDPAFLRQYIGKGLDDARWEVTKYGGDFEAIAGATYTPRAVTRSAEEALQIFGERQDLLMNPEPWTVLERY